MQATHVREGYLLGVFPGVVTANNDPEGIGRVRVQSPLIEENVDLPNDADGWIPVMEEFVVNANYGGSHRLIPLGAQVVLTAMGGDPTQLVVLGCLPSRVDRPHPEFDRANQRYGSVTPGNVIQLQDDSTAAQVIARPNGVTEVITPGGDITKQTEGSARVQLRSDGTSLLENDQGYTGVAPDGTVSAQSPGGASSVLAADGNVAVSSGQGSQMNLTSAEGVLTGPLAQVSLIARKVQQELSSILGPASEFLSQAAGAVDDFEVGGDIEGLLSSAQNFLKRAQAASSTLKQGIQSFEQLASFSPGEIGDLIGPQVNQVLGLAQNSDLIQGWLSDLSVDEVADRLQTLTEQEIDSESFAAILNGLSHDPALQLQAALAEITPGGFSGIQSVVGSGLHPHLATVQSLLDASTLPQIPDDSEEDGAAAQSQASQAQAILARDAEISDRVNQLSPILQSANIEAGDVRSLVANGSSVQNLLANSVHTKIRQATEVVNSLPPLLSDGLSSLNNVFDQAILGQDLDLGDLSQLTSLGIGGTLPSPEKIVEEFLPKAVSDLKEKLQPLLEQGNRDLNGILNAIPQGIAGSKVRALRDFAQMETDMGGLGAIVKITRGIAQVIGPGGNTRLFADALGAGVSTPWGGFGFGSGGGFFSGVGQMAFSVARSKVGGAGLSLSPNPGVSIVAYHPDNMGRNDRPSSRVTALGNVASMQVLAPDGSTVLHEIAVRPDGIYLDGLSLAYLASLDERLGLIEGRLLALENP
jgi:hypothetical protein